MKTALIVLCIAEFIRYCLLGGYFDLNYILFPNLNLVLLLHKTFLNTCYTITCYYYKLLTCNDNVHILLHTKEGNIHRHNIITCIGICLSTTV